MGVMPSILRAPQLAGRSGLPRRPLSDQFISSTGSLITQALDLTCTSRRLGLTFCHMKFDKAIPMLYSTDVAASVAYFRDKLKLANSWTWDDPPTFAGLYDGTVEIFFCKGDQGSPATWI